MDFHENECILMDFLVRTSSREIAAADTLTGGGRKGSWVSTFGMLMRASDQAYFFCTFCEKVTKKIGSLDLVH